ncbi:hypothetical protein AAHC03_026784 [Spirometra sp. Aus1]
MSFYPDGLVISLQNWHRSDYHLRLIAIRFALLQPLLDCEILIAGIRHPALYRSNWKLISQCYTMQQISPSMMQVPPTY